MFNPELDSLDRKIIELIQNDARVPFLEVAKACGVSGAAIHQRIQKLNSAGVLRGSQFIIDPEKIGYETCAFVGLYLKNPDKADKVIAALQKMPEVVECHQTSAPFDLFVKIYAYNNSHLMGIISEKLQPLGLSRTETVISFREAINRSVSIVDYGESEE